MPTVPQSYPRRFHKRIRLPADIYASPGTVVSVSVATRDRLAIFRNVDLAAASIGILKARADVTGVLVHAYCVMPDHVHLLAEPSITCDILTFVGQVKNLVQRECWRLGVKGKIWQTSFWDHVVRDEPGLLAAIRYVLANPVKAGLVDNWRAYPFVGSLVHDVSDL